MDRDDCNDCNVSIVSDSLVLRKGLAALLKAHAGLRVVGSHSGLLLEAFNKPDAPNGSGTMSMTAAPSVPSVPNPPGHVVLVDGGAGRDAVVAWTRYWRNLTPPAQVVVIELPKDMDLIMHCIRAGAAGYVARGAAPAEVVEAIGQVRHGEAHFSPDVAVGLLAWVAAHDSEQPASADTYAYTPGPVPTLSDYPTLAPEVPAIPAGRVIAVGPDCPAGPEGAAVPRCGAMDQDSLRLTHRELQVICLMAEGCTNREIAEKLVITLNTVRNHVHNILGKLELDSRRQVAPFAPKIGRVSDEAGHGPSADWN